MKSGNLNLLEPSGPLQFCNGTALPFVMKSGNLNFLEPSGPLQACNGTAVPFLLLIIKSSMPILNVFNVFSLVECSIYNVTFNILLLLVA